MKAKKTTRPRQKKPAKAGTSVEVKAVPICELSINSKFRTKSSGKMYKIVEVCMTKSMRSIVIQKVGKNAGAKRYTLTREQGKSIKADMNFKVIPL